VSLPSRSQTNARRHALIAEYRRKVIEKYEVVLFPHQAEWILAGEGWVLTEQAPQSASDPHTLVMLEDESIESRLLVPRPGGAAHVLSDLAGFKSGKSFGGALWMSGFAGVDGAVDIIGLEYDTSEPEFNYLIEFLVSERGMGLKYESLRNNKKDGAMWLTLENGAHFECKSYRASRKSETMKGKTRDGYYFSEAYQLPGFHVWTHVAQNVRQRDGSGVFATTPDRAWVRELHDKAHGKDPYYHCTCDIDAECNPFTFDRAAKDRDDPDKGGLMTRERFAIAWGGKVNRHIGAVYDYEKAAQMSTPLNFPQLWSESAVNLVADVIAGS
jgi:hypothetical protein